MPIHEEMTIITLDGLRQLKQLKKITKLLDGNGVFQDVLATYVDDYYGYFYEFHFKAIPFTFKCTPDHQIYRLKDIEAIETSSTKPNKQVTIEKPAFERASDISIYEYMAIPFLQEIPEVLPPNLPIDKDNFWFLIGVILNRIAIEKHPKIEVNRITLQLFSEEMKLVKFPDEINKIPTVNGIVLLNPNLSSFVSKIIENPYLLLYLPLRYQAAIYNGFFFDPTKPPSTLEEKIMFVIWYIYCRVNKKLANIIYSKNKEYQLNISANPTPCTDTHIWVRIKDIRVSVERTRVYLFKTEQPSVVINNFVVKPA